MNIPLDTTFDNRDPYRILGVASDVSPADLRKAYLGLAKKNHPNLFATDPDKYRASTALMQDINAAYDLLSDPDQRAFWDRKHPGAPRVTSKPKSKIEAYYDGGLVDSVIRSYKDFLSSLRTEAERKESLRRIRKFQRSREGSIFIRRLVARHYQKVMDLVKLGRVITMYDDGLVEILFLYTGTLEVTPSDIFVTYAYLLHQRGGRMTAAGRGNRQPPGPTDPGGYRSPEAGTRQGPLAAATGFANDLRARIWDWLVSSYRSRR